MSGPRVRCCECLWGRGEGAAVLRRGEGFGVECLAVLLDDLLKLVHQVLCWGRNAGLGCFEDFVSEMPSFLQFIMPTIRCCAQRRVRGSKQGKDQGRKEERESGETEYAQIVVTIYLVHP